MDIPYTSTARPDTGLYNAKLGIWLFLASEAMLFGGFFAAYIFLRMAAGADWPTHGATGLDYRFGLLNTVVLIFSSMAMVMAWAALGEKRMKAFTGWMITVLGCAALFMFIKITFEYVPKIEKGYLPSASPFYSIYFTMTGLHGLHVIGGALVLAYHWLSIYPWFPGYKVYKNNPQQLTNRLEVAGLFWHLVDLIWIFLFPLYYLL